MDKSARMTEDERLLSFVTALVSAGFEMSHCFDCQMSRDGNIDKFYTIICETFGVSAETAESWFPNLRERKANCRDSGTWTASMILHFIARKKRLVPFEDVEDQVAFLKNHLILTDE
jgi:hypothetical protein